MSAVRNSRIASVAPMPEFVPPTFAVPTRLIGDGFHLSPLGPEHNAKDYEAWTTSADHIRATPGFIGRSWPREMSRDENLGDLVRHRADFEGRQGFTYTVLSPSDEVIGCVYIYPSEDPRFDADVQSWVRADHAQLDGPLHDAVRDWLSGDWPFTAVDYAPRLPQ